MTQIEFKTDSVCVLCSSQREVSQIVAAIIEHCLIGGHAMRKFCLGSCSDYDRDFSVSEIRYLNWSQH